MPSKQTIYEVLEGEHREVAQLIQTLQTSTDPTERERIFREMRSALEAHSDCEDKTFYRALDGYEETADQLQDAHREHIRIAEILAQIDETLGEDPWTTLVADLKECVEHHVREEETVMIPQAREVLSDEEAIDLARQFLSEKEAYFRS